MVSKYFTHFIAATGESGDGGEWSGIVELTRPLARAKEERELCMVLASSLDVEEERIYILDWSRLH
jgi:hypothetical protein